MVDMVDTVDLKEVELLRILREISRRISERPEAYPAERAVSAAEYAAQLKAVKDEVRPYQVVAVPAPRKIIW